MSARVHAVCRASTHGPGKRVVEEVELRAGRGVVGDAHSGETVQHLSRIARDPEQPNLRQVHLFSWERIEELVEAGFPLAAGSIGENVTTHGVDLHALPRGTKLRLGRHAVVALTGLRNPCHQLNGLAPGLLAAMLDRAPDGGLVRKAGVMGVVLQGGTVRAEDPIEIERPREPHAALEPV